MKCPHCNSEIQDGSSVCPECGKPIYEIHTKIQSTKDERKLTKKILKYGLITIIVLLIIVSAAYIILSNNNNSNTNNFIIGSCTMEVPSNINLTEVNTTSNTSNILQTYVDTNNNVMVAYLNTSTSFGANNAQKVSSNLNSYTPLTNESLNENCTIYRVSSKIGYNYIGTYHSSDAFITIGGDKLNDIANMLNSIKS